MPRPEDERRPERSRVSTTGTATADDTKKAEHLLNHRLLRQDGRGLRLDCTVITVFVVVFTLAAASSPAFAQTRIEQNNPAIVYSGNWYTNDSAANTGSQAVLTNTKGARASITFNGTGIAWIGVADAYAGLATVYLDGSMQVINTYNPISQYQKVLFQASELAPGAHTFSIEVTHERGPGTDGSWVWIDAFDIQGTPVAGGVSAGTGRVEQNNAAMTFTGHWYANNNPALSGGSAALAVDAGARASLAFTGSGVSWITYQDQWSGMARVYIDGDLKTTLDNYASPARTGVAAYTIGGLGSGAHTITIEVTGSRNASSQGSWVWIDAFDVTP
jgi:hypothetical protein